MLEQKKRIFVHKKCVKLVQNVCFYFLIENFSREIFVQRNFSKKFFEKNFQVKV